MQPPRWLPQGSASWKGRALLLSYYIVLGVAAYMRFDAGQPVLGRSLVLALVVAMVGGVVLFARRRMPAIEQTVQDPSARAEFFQYLVDSKRAEWERLLSGGRSRYVLRVAAMYMQLLVIPLMVIVVLAAPSGLMTSWMWGPQTLAWLLVVLIVAAVIAVVHAYRLWDRAGQGWAARDAETLPPSA